MFNRSLAIARKETRELLRDPVYLGLAFVVPISLMLLLGFGLTMDVKHLPIVFVDRDQSPVSRDYIDGYVHSEYFDLVGVLTERREADALLRAGTARVIIEMPPDFTRATTGGEPSSVGVTVDGSYPSRASVINGYVTAINGLYNQRLIATYLAERGVSRDAIPPVRMDMSVWYNPSLDSKNFIIPGEMVIILMLFPAMLGALLIVRERESGTIFNLFSAPVRRWEIIAGKALPYTAVAFLDCIILFGMSLFLFQVRFVGSFTLLASSALLYSACTVGIGLLISIVTRTQLAAMLLTFLLTVTPAVNFSGFLAPVASQDAVGQFIAQLIPATYFMDIVRGSFLKGLGFEFYWPALLTMAGYTAVIYLSAWALLRKRIG